MATAAVVQLQKWPNVERKIINIKMSTANKIFALTWHIMTYEAVDFYWAWYMLLVENVNLATLFEKNYAVGSLKHITL